MNTFQQILTKYWGFSQFKPLQEDVINAIDNKQDTLVLMPTGGGKSITFQVPALAKEGTCIVITPLIALMRDQVERLNHLGIKAVAIYSGMSQEEIKLALNNCIYGGYKFLYCSPERIQTELFQYRLEKMHVNLIAVDEAHCISQWGYDFRPSYLKIYKLREKIPDAPVLALTATAPPSVVDDIQKQLSFQQSNVLKSSFERKNIVYWVKKTEDKPGYLLKLASRLTGTGIIYVRTRRRTRELSELLNQHGLSADYYHGGLSIPVRNDKQQKWQAGNPLFMVATNAFGMGIDKADVRGVIHYDLPDSLEAYYQEAGRAGRDGKTSFAVCIYNDTDIKKARKRLADNFPEISTIKKIYNALANYYQVPLGGGKNQVFDFKIGDFASTFHFNTLTIYNSLKFLKYEGYLEVTDEINHPSRVHFIMNRDDLYKFQVANAAFDRFIKILLRSYTGLFTEYVKIDENQLAKWANTDQQTIYQYLVKLSKYNVIRYIPKKRTPLLIFIEERLEDKALSFSKEHYEERKKNYQNKLESVIAYATTQNKCRSQYILSYFGETNTKRCGQCDYCQRRNELNLSKYEFDLILEEIKALLHKEEELPVRNLINRIDYNEHKTLKVVRWLIDNNKMKYTTTNNLKWNEKS